MLDVDLPERLAARLKEPLPGRAVQLAYEAELSFGRHFGPADPRAMPAAVLVLLYPWLDGWHLPLTARPASMLAHAGQISLPGGRVEPGETSAIAVLRELEEELGVPAQPVTLLGQLSPLWVYSSNFLVTPWVAVMRERPAFAANPHEVAELLEVPLAHLADPANTGVHSRRRLGVAFKAAHFSWRRHRIWGATSMILAELVAIVREIEQA